MSNNPIDDNNNFPHTDADTSRLDEPTLTNDSTEEVPVDNEDKGEMKPIPVYEGKNVASNVGWSATLNPMPDGYTFDRKKAIAHSTTEGRIKHVMEHVEEAELSESDDTDGWLLANERGSEYARNNKAIEERIGEEGSDWQQSLEHEGRVIEGRSPNMSSPRGRAQGTAGVLKVQAMLGLGAIIYVPLPHSVMYIAIKTAPLSDLLDLERLLVSNKISLGRYTFGASFTSDEAAKVEDCMRMVLRHVYESSIGSTDVEELLNAIVVTDYPIILNAMAQNLYPKGYDYYQPCMFDPRQCQHVIEGRVDLSKMIWYDRSRFSQAQLKLLSNPRGRIEADEHKKLKAHFTSKVKYVYPLNDTLRVEFKVPTLTQFHESSSKWFGGLIQSIDSSLEMTTQEREVHLLRASRLEELCKYQHWVSRISWGDEANDLDESTTGFMDAPEDIYNVLRSLSDSDEASDVFVKAVDKFIADCTVALVGIPDYKCPSCGNKTLPDDNVSSIIPVSMVNVFTALVTLKRAKAEERKTDS